MVFHCLRPQIYKEKLLGVENLSRFLATKSGNRPSSVLSIVFLTFRLHRASSSRLPNRCLLIHYVYVWGEGVDKISHRVPTPHTVFAVPHLFLQHLWQFTIARLIVCLILLDPLLLHFSRLWLPALSCYFSDPWCLALCRLHSIRAACMHYIHYIFSINLNTDNVSFEPFRKMKTMGEKEKKETMCRVHNIF